MSFLSKFRIKTFQQAKTLLDKIMMQTEGKKRLKNKPPRNILFGRKLLENENCNVSFWIYTVTKSQAEERLFNNQMIAWLNRVAGI